MADYAVSKAGRTVEVYDNYRDAVRRSRDEGDCLVTCVYKCGCIYMPKPKPSNQLRRDPYFLPLRYRSVRMRRRQTCVAHGPHRYHDLTWTLNGVPIATGDLNHQPNETDA